MAQQAPLPPGAVSPDSPLAGAPNDSPATAENAGAASSGQTVSPALAAAEDKIEARHYDEARPILLRILEAQPKNARAWFDQGYVEDSTGQEERAAEDYRKAILLDPTQFEARAALGLLLAQTGKDDEARTQLETAATLEPANHDPAAKAQALRTLAKLQVDKTPDAAQQSLLAALKLTPGQITVPDLLLTAEIAERDNDTDSAATAYQRALALEPASPAATAGLSHLLLEEKKYADAEALLRTALVKSPNDPTLNTQLASALAGQDKTAEAIPVLERAHTLQPENAAVGLTLADAYMLDAPLHPESLTKAGALLPALLQQHGEDVGLLMDWSRYLFQGKRFAEALPALEKAEQLAPTDVDPLNGLAFAYTQLSAPAETLNALDKRAKIAQDTPETLFLRATAYDSLHKRAQAAGYYQKFLAAAAGTLPDEEWQARHRLIALRDSR